MFDDVYDKTCLHYMKGKDYVMCNKVHDSCKDCKDYTKARLTHSELVDLAARYLRYKGYEVILTEPGYRSELPDAIGFKSGCSCLIECKASRSDFLKDKKKPFRNGTVKGIGSERIYLTNPNVANVHDLPPKWKLMWAVNENELLLINPFPIFGYSNDLNEYRFSSDERNIELENDLLYSWCWRSLHYYTPTGESKGKKLEVYGRECPKYAQEVFDKDGYCGFCIHRDNLIDKCSMSWEDSKLGDGYYHVGNKKLYMGSGTNRTGLIFQDFKHPNGQQCKGFELDRKVMFSEKNDYKESK